MDEYIGFAFFGSIVVVPVSCWIAARAEGEGRLLSAWGFLGPVGWIVAAIRGASVVLEDIRTDQRSEAARRIVADNAAEKRRVMLID